MAVLEHVFGGARHDEAWARTMAVNSASRAVMRRLGMDHVRSEMRTRDEPMSGAEQGVVMYEITRHGWSRRFGEDQEPEVW